MPAEKQSDQSTAGCECLGAQDRPPVRANYQSNFAENRLARRCSPGEPAADPRASDRRPGTTPPSVPATERETAAPGQAEVHACRASAATVQAGCAAKPRRIHVTNRLPD